MGRWSRIWTTAAIALLWSVSPLAVGTLTVTTKKLPDAKAVKYTLAWVSDAAGAVSGNTAALGVVVLGHLQQVQFTPDGGGTAPTALYDVTLVDAAGVDYLAGAGANLSATASTLTRVAAPLLHDGTGTLDLVVANAGISKGGTVVLWMIQQ